MQFRPCIDLHNGIVKQIVGSSLNDTNKDLKTNFSSDKPSAYYSELYKKDNLTGGHIIKLGPNNDSAATEALAAWPKSLQIGGGITADNAKQWLDAGASHIIVTSYVFKDGNISFENLEKLVNAVGKENIVLDLSCKQKDNDYFIVTDRWQNFTQMKLTVENLELLAKYADEFLVHAASVEGKMAGPDLELVKLLAKSPIPVTYAGGIASISDIENVHVAGNGKVHITIGSALDIFGGNISYDEVVKKCKSY